MDTFWALLLGGAAVALYFLPAIAASRRRHRNAGAITMLNLLTGWTVLGWIIAMVWSATDNVASAPEGVPEAARFARYLPRE